MASSSVTAVSAYAAKKSHTYSVTALNRWSIINKNLPEASTIKTIHIYDFDNTLFRTPLPNAQIWAGQTLGLLASNEILFNGGWWHDCNILAATGQGADKEEARAWEGWWNEKIVELVRLSMQQTEALTILLTGRSENGFSELIKRMIKSKGLEFDMVGLKPSVGPENEKFASTMRFKQMFLEAVMFTYPQATELRIYEDRPKHVKGFRDFFAEFNYRMSPISTSTLAGPSGSQKRASIKAEVIQVADTAASLEPVVEVAEVQRMVNAHNKAVADGSFHGKRFKIKQTVFFTSYSIGIDDAKRLITLADVPAHMVNNDVKYHGTNILICTRPCPRAILKKVGGIGAKMTWRVVSVGNFENTVWAARLAPVPANAAFHTDSAEPMVVLAVRKGTRPSAAMKINKWVSVAQESECAFVFESAVAEKVTLRIESEDTTEDEYESLVPTTSASNSNINNGSSSNANNNSGSGSKTAKRKHSAISGADEDNHPPSSHGHPPHKYHHVRGGGDGPHHQQGHHGHGHGHGNSNHGCNSHGGHGDASGNGYRGRGRGGGRSRGGFRGRGRGRGRGGNSGSSSGAHRAADGPSHS
ncbi:hypothetical protein TD95_003595 [Thielaviopsis punctulata]|uniref:Swiss Army Knife RNA repair protein HAD domain-containing protein n=1 Tax=Thielaviopsis punctulata TaxID=72032 RepID=A0A0F4Z769_9PEZI|nr:hypothetical protein TD95_003595 [Thielaviopsis punctulata]